MILKKLKKSLITGNSIALLGEAGVGKTTLVKGLAFAIKTNDVPSCLKDKNIISLNTNELLSGTNFRGDLEAKMSNLLKIAKDKKDIIFFFDEMHTLMGGKCREDDINFANILKPALSDKDIQIIGATTINEWDEWIAKDSAFRERFKTINLPFPSDQEMTDILLNYKNILESEYTIKFDIDKCFFDELVKYTNKKNSIQHYETMKNPRLSLRIIDDIFANAIYEEENHITKEHIIEAISDNEVLTEQTKKDIIADIPNILKTSNEEKNKIIKLK